MFAVCRECNINETFKFNEAKYTLITRSLFNQTGKIISSKILDVKARNYQPSVFNNKYILYYSRFNDIDDGKCYGLTIQQLKSEFKKIGLIYKYAWITEINNKVILYAFQEEWGRFVSFKKRKSRDDSESYVHPVQVFGETFGFRTKKRQFTKLKFT